MSKLNGDTKHIPANFAGDGLNLRAFVDLPPKQVTLEQEVMGVIDKVRTGMCRREEAVQAIVRIIGRETSELEEAVRRALRP
jgi:hypothetical protein